MLVWQNWRALRGPNVWSRRPVMEFVVSCPEMDPTSLHRVWSEVTVAAVGGDDHKWQSFDADLVVELIAATVMTLQRLSGSPVAFSGWRATGERAWQMALASEDESLTRACCQVVGELLAAAVVRQPLSLADALLRLRTLAESRLLGCTTRAIVAAAEQRGIPVQRLSDDSLVQLGHGIRQRRVSAMLTNSTGELAEQISSDKLVTKRLLRQIGLPVPEGRLVTDAEDAWEAARELGAQVVVKPRDADFGQGVTLALCDRASVIEAYELARTYRQDVLVERFHEGISHRLLIIGRQLAAAVRREPSRVFGDGVHSIRELVDIANRDPRRGDSYEYPLFRLNLGEEEQALLAAHGWRPDTVPAVGETVYLRRDPCTYHGGTNEDITDRVHPETVRMAMDAALMVGLDVAGIDLVATDISRPLKEQGGAFLEVNAEPAINLHRAPVCDRPRPVVEALLEDLFPNGRTGRIPLLSVIGGRHGIEVSRLMAEAWPVRLGFVTAIGTTVEGTSIDTGASSIHDRVEAVLSHPRVGRVIVQATLGDVLQGGVPWDRCRTLVVTDLETFKSPGMAIPGSSPSREDLDRAWHVLIATCKTRRRIVLNVDDAAVARRAEGLGRTACLVSNDYQHPLLQRALRRGQPVVTWRHGQIWWRCGDQVGAFTPHDGPGGCIDDYELRRHQLLLQAARLRWPRGGRDLSGPRRSCSRAA